MQRADIGKPLHAAPANIGTAAMIFADHRLAGGGVCRSRTVLDTSARLRLVHVDNAGSISIRTLRDLHARHCSRALQLSRRVIIKSANSANDAYTELRDELNVARLEPIALSDCDARVKITLQTAMLQKNSLAKKCATSRKLQR